MKSRTKNGLLPVLARGRAGVDVMTDVVVIGSGPAALAAAVEARTRGWEVLCAEPTQRLGGKAAESDGLLWLPGRGSVDVAGRPDDYATTRDYFDRIVTTHSEASSPARRHAFLTATEPMAHWLGRLGVALTTTRIPDHYPEEQGGCSGGRVMRPDPIDSRELGPYGPLLPAGRGDGSLASKMGRALLTRQIAGGSALVAGLLAAALQRQATLWWDAEIVDLMVAEGRRVMGVVAHRAGRDVRVFAGKGVIVASGGFGSSDKLRRDYLPALSRASWSLGGEDVAGIRQLGWAEALGIQVEGLGDAWWRPALWNGADRVEDASIALAAPHGFLVDATGARFCNEAAPGVDVSKAIFARAAELGDHQPVWLIVDARGRRGLPFGAREGDELVRARSLAELAWTIKVDPAALQATADRFDGFAASGVDADFGRGMSAFDRSQTEGSRRQNPNLGEVTKAPFYAVRVVPADTGTKGGWLTDEDARVLGADGPVPGLWAAGSAAASVTGAYDPAPGVGLAEAMVCGRRAAISLSASAELP